MRNVSCQTGRLWKMGGKFEKNAVPYDRKSTFSTFSRIPYSVFLLFSHICPFFDRPLQHHPPLHDVALTQDENFGAF